jgi:hypothetical protein
MIETRAKWGELIPDVGLKISEFYDQGNDLYTPGIINVIKVTSGDGAQRNFTGKTGAGNLRKFAEGEAVPKTERHKTYNTSIIYQNYGAGLEVTKNMIEDRNFAAELDEMSALSKKANFHKDEGGMQLFNGAFATTEVVRGHDINWYGDGVPLASTVHPTVVPGASTQSNASSTGITLGVDNYETGSLALEMQNADNGDPVSLTGMTTMVTGLTLQREGQEIAQSSLNPENANNAINVFSGVYDQITSKMLDAAYGGSDTQWFLMKKGDVKIGQEVRQEKRLTSHVWASKGDGSAYSS